MTDAIKILVVEDDSDQWQTYVDAANDTSSEELTIELTRYTSAAEARTGLLSNNFDGAIVDLNLSPDKPEEASGNEVLLQITGAHRFPVLVVSGNLGNLDPRINCSSFLRTYERDTPNDEIFGYLLKIYSTGITKILGGRGQIEKSLGEIFWRHLAHDFGNWDAGSLDSERTLLRYVVAHLAEYLDIPDGEDNFYHEAEFYVRPPIRKHIATGDIVERDGFRFIVLSPACDVAVRGEDGDGKPVINAERVVLAPLVEVARDRFLERQIIKAENGKKAVEKVLEKIIKGQRDKYALLPQYGDMYPAIVDLQNLHTLTLDEYLDLNRIATVSGVFLKDIQSRFSAYYGRQGQPELKKDVLLGKYAPCLLPSS